MLGRGRTKRGAKSANRRKIAAVTPGHYIPVRKADLVDALAEGPALATEDERRAFRTYCAMIGNIFHFEMYETLECLKDSYFYFNPETAVPGELTTAQLETQYQALYARLQQVLSDANFTEISKQEVQDAHETQGLVQVPVKVDLDDFREVRLYRRGQRRETRTVRRFFGFWNRTVELDVFESVVLLIVVKTEAELPEGWQKRTVGSRPMRPFSVMIKYFRNVPSADLNTLLPNVRAAMSLIDKLMLGVPALFGGIPLIMNLVPALTVLMLVLGFYLGVRSELADEEMAEAVAALGGLAALGGFLMRQWMKFERQALKYQKEISDNIYYRNINNNVGFFDYIIGAAEAQECKEAILGYHFVLTAEQPPTKDELDQQIEAWLAERFKTTVDFEIGDALGDLIRFGLVKETDGRLTAVSLADALVTLDTMWDNYFKYNGNGNDPEAVAEAVA